MTDKTQEVKELIEECLLPDEELEEQAEMIYNFRMDISGIKNLLWQICRKQVKDTILIIKQAVAGEIKRELEKTFLSCEFMVISRGQWQAFFKKRGIK